MNIMNDKLKKAGLRNLNSYTVWSCETIFVQDGIYYPTILRGYKGVGKCHSLKEAQEWINERKK